MIWSRTALAKRKNLANMIFPSKMSSIYLWGRRQAPPRCCRTELPSSTEGGDRNDPRCAFHYGNQTFALLVSTRITAADNLRDLLVPSERVPVARDIVGEIRNSGGRFLARTKKGTLKDIDNELAIRWASLCIRRAVESSINDIENVGDV